MPLSHHDAFTGLPIEVDEGHTRWWAALLVKAAWPPVDRRWAWMSAALGFFLAVTGTHMTLTWPLKQIPGAGCCAVDNVTFGEPAMFFGYLTFFAAIALMRAERAALDRGLEFDLVSTVRPFLYAGAFGGIGLIMFAAAGLEFGMWAPAPRTNPSRDSWAPRFSSVSSWRRRTSSPGGGDHGRFRAGAPRLARVFAVTLFVAGMMWTLLSFTLFYGHVGFFPFPH